MMVKRTAIISIVVTSALAMPAFAGTGKGDLNAGVADAWAQAQPKTERARTRIRVTPRYPYRTESLPYPPPYDIEYPGPGFVRQCNSWLAAEYRPSGTVIVPHSRCWWERG